LNIFKAHNRFTYLHERECIECTGAFVWTRSNHGSFVGSEFKSELLYVLQLVVIRIFPNHWKLYDKPSKWLIFVSIPSSIHWTWVSNVNSCTLYPTIWCVTYVLKKVWVRCGYTFCVFFFQIIMMLIESQQFLSTSYN
jgi:hypothetical protein